MVNFTTVRSKIIWTFTSLAITMLLVAFVGHCFINRTFHIQNEIINISKDSTLPVSIAPLRQKLETVKSYGVITMWLLASIALAISMVLLVRLIKALSQGLEEIRLQIEQLAEGNLPSPIDLSKTQSEGIVSALNSLTSNLLQVKSFAEEVGNGHFDSEVVVFNNKGMLGESLAQMRKSLKDVAAEDQIRNWTSDGVAKFANLLRQNNDNLENLCNVFLKDLIKYLSANQGAVFTTETNEGEVVLEMKACYAYERRKHQSKTLHIGEGLAGQAYLEKETIFLTDIPPNYFTITSGLGDAVPRSILIVPLKLNDTVMGILELASLQIFRDQDIALVEKLAESLAATLSSVKVAEETNRLLQESLMSGEQLRSQEEEMRQNLEEIQATQEQLQRQTEEMRAIQDKLMLEKSMFSVLMEYLPDRLTYKDTESRIIRVNQAKAKRFNLSPDAMIGTTDYDFFPEAHAAKARQEEIELLRQGDPMLDIQEKVGFDTGNIMFINTSRIPFKNEAQELIGIFIISKDITQQKLQEAYIQTQAKVLEGIMLHSPVFSYKVDAEGYIAEMKMAHHSLKPLGNHLVEKKHIQHLLPDFNSVVTRSEKGEFVKIDAEITFEEHMFAFTHHIFADSIYKDVYWGVAILKA